MDCVLTSACCLDLASAIVNNPNLQSLDLGNNDLQDDGVKFLFEALSHPNCNILRLGWVLFSLGKWYLFGGLYT